ncbi:MAG: SLC13 family permease [Dehalococcoidales bacterium]
MSLAQILALIIFALMFAAITSGKIHRYIAALIGAALMIVIVFLIVMKSPHAFWSVLNLAQLGHANFWLPGAHPIESQGVNWQTIIFIGGMMVMVCGLEAVGFFRWLCLYTARLAGCRVVPILVSFMLLSGFLSMFIDSITVMLFLSMVTIELARLLKFDPVPIIVAEIFAANTGGSATMSGDPPNIIIGTAYGFTFTDFAVNTGLIAWAGMLLAILYFYFVFRKSLKQQTEPAEMMKACPLPGSAIINPLLFRLATGVFITTVVLLITHAQTGLSVATIGVISAVLSIAISGRKAPKILKNVDWRTILFFFGLFVCVSGLEVTGVLEKVARLIGDLSGGKLTIAMAFILWLSAFLSAFIDNIPFAATMVPIVSDLSHSGMSLPVLAWALSLGTDIGGNATPIGASANVVGTAVAEKEGYPIGWGRFLKYAALPMVLVVGLCHLLLIWRYT